MKGKPLGKALPRSDEELDLLSEITFADEDAAKVEATPEMRAHLEAMPEEPPA